jgi:hypothetical protein
VVALQTAPADSSQTPADHYAHAREAPAAIAEALAAPLMTCAGCGWMRRRAFLRSPVVVLWCDHDGHDLAPDELDVPHVCLRRYLPPDAVYLLPRGDYLELKKRFPYLWGPRPDEKPAARRQER